MDPQVIDSIGPVLDGVLTLIGGFSVGAAALNVVRPKVNWLKFAAQLLNLLALNIQRR